MPLLLLPRPGLAFPGGWLYRRLVTVDHTKVSADLTDFPVLVRLTAGTHSWAHAQTNGLDIRFATAADVPLPFEIERYDNAGQVAEFWVKLPTVSSTVDTTFWMYYGTAATVGDAQNPAVVWSNGYLGVFHLKENPTGTAPQHKDSTLRGGDATAVNLVSGDQAAGQIAGALTFDGTTKRLTGGNSLSVKGLTKYTAEAWVNITTLSAVTRSIYEEPRGATSNVTRMKFGISTANQFVLQGRAADSDGSTVWVTNTTALSTGQWYYVCGVFDSVADVHSFTVNAVRQTNAVAASTISATDPLTVPKIGVRADTTSEFFPGQIDELRISNTARSNSWIDASYASGLGTLLAVGSEQALGGQSRTTADSAPATDAATRLLVVARTTTDTAAGTDAATRGLTQARTATDTAAATDTATRAAATRARTTTDTAAATDASTRALTVARTVADTAAATDAATRTRTSARTTADSAPGTDTASRAALAVSRTASDTATGTDAGTRALTQARTAADSAAGTDAATRSGQSLARTTTDTAAGTDATTRGLNLARAGADTAHAVDTATRASQTLGRTAADSAPATDTAVGVGTGGQSRTATDTAPATDAAVRGSLTRARAGADTAAGTDSAGRALTQARAGTETAPAVDAATRVTTRARATADAGAGTDVAVIGGLLRPRTGADTAAASDAVATSVRLSVGAADAAPAVDAAGGSLKPFARPPGLLVIDSPASDLAVTGALTGGLTVTDAAAVTLAASGATAPALAVTGADASMGVT